MAIDARCASACFLSASTLPWAAPTAARAASRSCAEATPARERSCVRVKVTPCLLQFRGGRADLRNDRRQRRFRLVDLIRGLPLLEPERRLRFAHLGGEAGDVVRVVRGIRLQLFGIDDREQLVLLDRVALGHQQLRGSGRRPAG